MQLAELSYDARYTVEGYRGIAFYLAGPDFNIMDRIDEEDDSQLVENGMVRMVMVGDDREHIIDPVDVTLVEGSVCSCGQLGCGWDAQ